MVCALFLVGCGGSAPSEAAVALPSRPPLPRDWHVVEDDEGEIRIALPPGVNAGDTCCGSVFANEPPSADGRNWFELVAVAPRSAHPQPGPAENLDGWLERYLEGAPGRGPGTTRYIDLPAGPAVELATSVAGAGEPIVVLLYAIRTPAGVGVVQVDAPRDAIERRASDVELLLMLLEFGSRHRS